MLEYNKKILERERQLKEQQKKIDRENKAYHVQRTRKQNAFERERMINKLTTIDNKAKHLKEDRSDYMESRKFMVQKLKKDLEKMKAGLLDINEIERKYGFLHNDKEFQLMMIEIKREIHPGRFILKVETLLAKKKNKYSRLQQGVKSSMNLKPNASMSPDVNRSMAADTDKAKTSKDAKPADAKPADPKHPDYIKTDIKKEEMTEAEKSRVKKLAVAEVQQKQVESIH